MPPIFPYLQAAGAVPRREMYRVFNMGIGMALVTAPRGTKVVLAALRRAGERGTVVGRIVKGSQEVRLNFASR